MMCYPRFFIHLYFHQTTLRICSLRHGFCQESRLDTMYQKGGDIGKLLHL